MKNWDTTYAELNELLELTISLSTQCGQIAMSHYQQSFVYDESLVTQVELASFEFINSELKKYFPKSNIFGQNYHPDDTPPKEDDYVWVIDALDGTSAYSSSVPIWSISMALFISGKPAVGVVNMPATEETYYSIYNHKAFLNGEELQVTDCSGEDNDSTMLTYSRFHQKYTVDYPGKLRSFGSTAAHLAYLARGTVSAVLIDNVHLWDIAAGAIILQSAGGEIHYLDGNRVDFGELLRGEPISDTMLATPKGIYPAIAHYIHSF